MRSIIRKLDRELLLNSEEYNCLVERLKILRQQSPDSYRLFYDRYAPVIQEEYIPELPLFSSDLDDFISFLCFNPELIDNWENNFTSFPLELHPFLTYLKSSSEIRFKRWLNDLLHSSKPLELPTKREKELVVKYEEGNPYKETGIKNHFDRLSRYPFISRLQTYRYLTRSKAVRDRIEYLRPDQLGGIFTNKEKSIYYYIFLTESNEHKARYACSFLNQIFYGS